MKVLITGVNGFIGSNIHNELLKKHEILGISQSKTSKICDKYISCDLTDKESLEKVIKEHKDIDVIVHCAALAHNKGNDLSKERFMKVNYGVSKDLVDMSNEYLNLKHFIFLSTISVYGERVDKSVYTEEDECYPRSPYAVAKRKSEEYIQENCKANYYILRLAPVYSDEFRLNIKRRTEIKGFNYIVGKGDNKLSLCNIKNIIVAINEIINNNILKNEIYNISDNNVYLFSDILYFNRICKYNIIIPKVLIKILLKINNLTLKKQFIEENSIKLISDNVYSSQKIAKNIEFTYNLFDERSA